ncbi:transcriptional regulator [Amycolatopsis sp. NPDC059021]|uniref:transcriptional regulator n=1 Tax=Amycolatopsis sp. NPDC059021 TaxID=3346704 RepID=UPI00366B7226
MTTEQAFSCCTDSHWPVVGRGRIGCAEVRKVEAETRTFRALDYRYGGGWCRDAVAAQLNWALRLLDADCSSAVRAALCSALADLAGLAGWTAFDSGRHVVAHAWLDHAAGLAGESGDDALLSNIRYRQGRVFLHHDAPREALGAFGRGVVAAESGGCTLMLSVLYANQAWAYAKLADPRPALAALGRAVDAFERADASDAPASAQFFGETDLAAMAGTVYVELAEAVDTVYAAMAVNELTRVVARYGDGMARSRSLCLTMLATSHLLSEDVDEAVAIADRALTEAMALNSRRFRDRLVPLERQARLRQANPAAQELADHVAEFRTAA